MPSLLHLLHLLLFPFANPLGHGDPPPKQSQQSNHLAQISTLKFVAAVTRHGSRAPEYKFATNKYPPTNKKIWPSGPGNLTEIGKWETVQLGWLLKRRYKGFLAESYNERDLLIAYNPFERDYFSGLCILNGLYQTKQHLNWCLKGGKGEDPLVLAGFDIVFLIKGECIIYRDELDRVIEEYDENEMKNPQTRKMLKFLSQKTGNKISNVVDICNLQDTLYFQLRRGYPPPFWSVSLFPEPMTRIAHEVLSIASGGSPKLIRLGAGPILKQLVDKIASKAKNDDEAEPNKMYIEVAHDVTIMALLSAITNKTTQFPVQPAGFMVFELHLRDGKHFIKVLFFENAKGEEPIEIDIKGCPKPCTLAKFSRFVNSIQPLKDEGDCSETTKLNPLSLM